MNIKLLMATTVFFPLILIIRLVKPILFVRVGQVRTDRIGHLAGNMDRHINYKNNNNIDPEAIDFYYVYGSISNRYLLKMWSQEVKIVQGFFSYFLYVVDIVNSFIPGGGSHTIPELNDDKDNLNHYSCNAPNLKFNKQERVKGENYLKSVGFSKADRFICFCVRDEAFLKEKFSNNDFSYHDYRNADIKVHVEALEKFIGGNNIYKKAIRMGSVVESKLTSRKIIDYSSSGNRNEFLDLFLSDKCDIFLNSGSGLDAVPRLFKTSLVSANIAPMGYIGGGPIVFIPKKYWHIKNKRFLTFKEILQSDIGYYLKSSDYINNGIELLENTSDDIYHALLEASDRINGVWSPDEEDLYMQEKFQSLFLPDSRFPSSRAPISAHFLRSNIDLLSG
jgi:putative glycosyltransferase (TIGR04372 family)